MKFNGEDLDDEDDDDILLGEDDNQQQQLAAPVAPAVPTIDHDAIAATVAATMQQQLASQPAPQRQMSQEELAQHFQVWNPGEDFVNDLNSINNSDATPAQKLKAIHALRDGIMQQAFRASQLLVEQQLGAFRQEMAPALTYAQQQTAKGLIKKFEAKYPTLKGQGELIDSITSKLNAQGFKPKSQDEAFDKVAEVAEKILKGVNPGFSLKVNAGANGMPAMAGTNMGGFGGNATVPQQRNSGSGKRGGLAKFYQT